MIAREAARILSRGIRTKIYGLEKVSGSDEEICESIIEKNYDKKKKFFRVSTQNYPIFYSRDFGICTPSLIILGHKKMVISTLDYALRCFSSHGGIRVAIDDRNNPFDFPKKYSPDSTAYFFRSLRLAGAKSLIRRYKNFLNSEIARFEDIVIDAESGTVVNKSFSGMRDYEIVISSTYDMVMACMLEQEIKQINEMMGGEILENKLHKYNLKKNLINYYYDKRGFFVNGRHDRTISGHVNIFPYYLGIITDDIMLEKSLKFLHSKGFDRPLPLKYDIPSSSRRFLWYEFIVGGWERSTAWSWLGMAYIDLLLSSGERELASKYLSDYQHIIENYGFVEVLDGIMPYSSIVYTSDTHMLWAAMYLDLKKRLA